MTTVEECYMEQILEATSDENVAVQSPISKTIQIRRIRNAGHDFKSKDVLVLVGQIYIPDVFILQK